MKALRSLVTACLVGWMATTPAAAADPAAEAFRRAFLAGELSWEQVVERARSEGELTWFYWGGNERLNAWIDTTAIPAMRELGIRLKSARVPDTRDAVDLAVAEFNAGRGIGQGAVDIIWINGENFYTLAQRKLTFGAFADKLPNSKWFDFSETNQAGRLNLYDFGFPTEKAEVPFSGGQYVCHINTAAIKRDAAPKTLADLGAWIRANPGRFTYARPPNFVGTTFVETVLYGSNAEGYRPFQQPVAAFTPETFTALIKPGFDFLRRIEPFLVGGGGADGRRGAPVYPPSHVATRGMFANGEVDIGCEFGIYVVGVFRQDGTFPTSSESIIFPVGSMIQNKNFLAIPANAGRPAAALVFANYIASPEAQISRLKAVGMPVGLDTEKLDAATLQAIGVVSPPFHGVSLAALAANAVPDTNSSLVNVIKVIWEEYIGRNATLPLDEVVRKAMGGK